MSQPFMKTPLQIHVGSNYPPSGQSAILKHTRSTQIMKPDELQEAHLQAALSSCDSQIPIPGVSQIDEEDYKRLYKEVDQDLMLKRRNFTFIDDTDSVCDYDCDSEDESWIESYKQEHFGSLLTEDNFEQSMEFLEKNCNQRTLPSKGLLISRDFTKEPEAEAIHEYWLKKRLLNGRRLIPEIKVGKSSTEAGNDPFVVFRPGEEKMKTRKNRAGEYAKYTKLLKLRSWFAQEANNWKSIKDQEIERHKELEKKFQEFQARYSSGSYKEDSFDQENRPQESDETVIAVESQSSEEAKCEQAQAEKKFLKPINPNVPVVEPGFFKTSSQSEVIRRRVGRGGRVIIDRKRLSPDPKKKTYKAVNINPIVLCSKYKSFLQPDTSSSVSVFKLTDIGIDENIQYNKIEFVEEE